MRQTISAKRVRKLDRAISGWAKAHKAEPWLVESCQRVFNQAVDDATRLDVIANEFGKPEGLTAELMATLEKGDAAWIEIWKLARLPLNQKTTRGLFSGDRTAEERSWTLYVFRELLRDGTDLKYALTAIFPRIAEFHIGDAKMILKLAKIIKRRLASPASFARGAEAWILRAWLPMGLWQLEPKVCELRLRHGYELMKNAGVSMPADFPAQGDLDKAIRRVRSKLKVGWRK